MASCASNRRPISSLPAPSSPGGTKLARIDEGGTPDDGRALSAAWINAIVPQALSRAGSCLMKTTFGVVVLVGCCSSVEAAGMALWSYAKIKASVSPGTKARQFSSKEKTS